MDFVANVGRRHRVEVNAAGTWVDLGENSLNGYERNVLWRQREAVDAAGRPTFDDVGFIEGANAITDGRAVAAFDADADGDLDLVVQNVQGQPHLLVHDGNATQGRNSLTVRLTGPRGNRDAIGARVVVETADGRTQQREVTSFAGYLAGQSTSLHFGLGDAERAERVTVWWPHGGSTAVEGARGSVRIASSGPVP